MGQKHSSLDEGLMQRHRININELEALKHLFREWSGGKHKALTRTKFREVYKQVFPGNSSHYADEMFRLFDEDGNGEVDFAEFVRHICLCDSDDIEERIQAAFRLYDKDNSGTITQTEVGEILEAYEQMLGSSIEDGKSGHQVASEFFEEMDADNDESVTLEEFTQAARRDSRILHIVNPKPPTWSD
ncbi:frequenin-1-like [Saccostrea echinata]|uniref:frequenin-1-like n=1 Tax=Saccostrea echinata TaxID=191078 RepID=UPI002A827E6B|nr:frequenin-1-like [Saccostrea echinata]